MMSAEDRTAAVGESPAEGENPAERKTPAEGRTSPEGSWLEQAPPLSTRTAGLAFRLYKQILSPVLHTLSFSQCLYRPTCSEYAYVAIARFGAARGCWLALRRLLRCHPWAHGGFDPVPDVASRSRAEAADHLR